MFEAYTIGIKMSLLNGVSSGLMLMSRDFAKTEAQATLLERRLNSIKKDALKGGLMLGVGVGMLALLKAPMDAARQYELAFTKFKTLNLGESVNKQADQFARGANLIGVSSKDLMTTLSESVGLFGGFDVAKKLAPHLANLNKANSAIFGGKLDHIDEGSTRALMKFIDRRGGTHDEGTFLRNLDLAQRMVTGSGGFVKFRDLDQFSQQGGTAFRGLSDQGILNMSLLLQEQGGARAGTSLMSLYQNLIAGRTPKKTMGLLQEMGLAKLSTETHGSVGGKPLKAMVMKDIKGGELLQANPPEWIRTVFLPALQANGVTSEAQILKRTNDLISNRTASNQASIMGTQILQMIRDANLAKNAMGANQTIQAYKNDPNSKFADLQAKYNGLMVELGLVVLPMAIKALQVLTPQLRGFGEWIRENPRTVKLLASAFVGLAASLAIRGTILLLSAGFRTLGLALTLGTGLSLPASISALGVAAAGLAAPIAIAVLAIGTIAGALYAFRPITKAEIEAAKFEGGAKLSASAAARIAKGELAVPSLPVAPRIPTVRYGAPMVAISQGPTVTSPLLKTRLQARLSVPAWSKRIFILMA
ncbi:hypothetical protein KIV45_15905 [Janthinobacterium lividum]|nr:hypothetical protein KIV45_15905 [Janthinobacterium lividum]